MDMTEYCQNTSKCRCELLFSHFDDYNSTCVGFKCCVPKFVTVACALSFTATLSCFDKIFVLIKIQRAVQVILPMKAIIITRCMQVITSNIHVQYRI